MRARLFVAAMLGLALAPLLGAAPASGHDDTIAFEIKQVGSSGYVHVSATWAEDRHPVEDPVVAMLTAASADGKRIGPLRLRPFDSKDGHIGVLGLEDPLPEGSWTIVAESSVPALGYGEVVAKVEPLSKSPNVAPIVLYPKSYRASAEPAWVVALAEVTVIASVTTLLSFAALWLWRRRPPRPVS